MGRLILLIDDSAMLRRIAANVLRAQPARYEVIAATRASEGFARACGGEAAMILVDDRIAGAADADFCRRLLDEPRTSGVPVVLLTSRNGDAPELDTLPMNVVEILSKPFAPEQLAGVVNAIAGLARRGVGVAEMRQALHSLAYGGALAPYADHPLPPEQPAKIEDPAPPVKRTCQASGDPGAAPARSSEPSIRAALQAAVADGQTGLVRFCPGDGISTDVFVDGGRLVLVTTRDGAAYTCGAAEVLPAKISPATLQEAAETQSWSGIPFLLTLGARGLVSKAAAGDLLRRFGQRHFARLWTFPAKSLRIEFERLEALPGFTLRLEPMRETVDEWLLGSLRLVTGADIAFEARHQGLVGTPNLHRRGEAILQALPLDEGEREFIRRVNGRNDLPTIAKSLGLTPEDTFLLVHRFRFLEILEYRPAPLPFVMTPRTNMRRVLPLKR